MKKATVRTVLAGVLLGGSGELRAQLEATKLLRYPDIAGDAVAFCYAGDLWRAPATGGTARRLTAHPGLEQFPRFSPDGQWIAFTGQYDGDEQVYVMPAIGGEPRQLTYYPARGPLPPRWGMDHQVYGWTPDGGRVLFRSLRDAWDLGSGKLYTVSTQGGLPVALPMPTAGAGSYSPDGGRMAYSPLFRDFRTWKRYQGGWAQNLWVFELDGSGARQITDHPRTERDPMWIGERIYYASDRTGTLNLYYHDLKTRESVAVTHETVWDVRWPADGDGNRIVYELAGELHVLDVASGQSTKLAIHVPDDGLAQRPSRVSAAEDIEDFGISPEGQRAVFTARGDVFTAPAEKGPTRNLTSSSSAHERAATWSPDGKQIAFLSDRDGEEELYVVDAKGEEPARRLTDGGSARRSGLEWSPDGEHLAFSDKDGKLWVLVVDGGELIEVARDADGSMRDYTWSPRGGFLAFSLTDPNQYRSLYLWGLEDRILHRVTDETFHEEQPAFDPDGDYLFYLSDREFAPQLDLFEWDFVENRQTGIFALALRKDVPHPFPPESDEVGEEEDQEKDGNGEAPAEPGGEEGEDAAGEEAEKDKETEAGKEEKKETEGPITIDFDGLAQRVARVPVSPDNYSGLTAVKDGLLYFRSGRPYYGRESDGPTSLLRYDWKKRKEATLAEKASGFSVSAERTKVLVRRDDGYFLYDAAAEGKDSGKAISTGGLMVDRVPMEEWRQIFDEVWRRFRDFFYAPNMHGYDWVELGARYRTLLDSVAHRTDLNYVLGEMISELSVSHAYIGSGDFTVPPRAPVALPGARFELDAGAQRYRIARIFRGQNEEERYRSPLTEVGVDARVGDYVLAIDGKDLGPADNPYRELRYKADRPVRLTLNDRPAPEGAREVIFVPRTSETSLVYLEWVLHNREVVDQASGGRAGYLHIPDMGADGIREFGKWYYGQIRKEALVVDVRSNGGGNVSQMILERLRRELLSCGYARTSDYPSTYPNKVFVGPMVCLLNETSASDGDIFPSMFREAGLGPLVGKRSWGGVIGISGHGPLIDGGDVFVPEFGLVSTEGEWIVEGHGVEPDVVVENDPIAVLQGRDPQLEKALQIVLEELAKENPELPARPPDPIKTTAAR